MTTQSTLFTRSSLGYVRIAAVTPELRVADVAFNTAATIASLDAIAKRGCQIAVLPELGITAYTCGDLFYQTTLIESARLALRPIAEAAAQYGLIATVGLPLLVKGKLYNCAAFLGGGKVLGIVPKTFLPTTNEYYEERWFTSSHYATETSVDIDGVEIPFGVDLLFNAANMDECVVGIEVCEDLWTANPLSGDMALAGAAIILNPSASVDLLGKSDYRRDLVKQQSARCLVAYAYAGAGPNESTTDTVYGGHSMIAENGALLFETERFQFNTQYAIADIDLQRLTHERISNSSFSAAMNLRTYRRIRFELSRTTESMSFSELLRPVAQTPFVPSDHGQRARNCREIFSIQSTGLAKRLRHTGAKRVTIGISGGLDSTLALLVTLRAFDIAGLPHEGITAITMPGFGTTSRTRSNAERLTELLGLTALCIPIHASVQQHFTDIGHDEHAHDITYENAQARERTQILMDVANQIGGFVVGTGDLSELALGWATFNGDHMSMYHVNAGVPKTLVRYLIEWSADSEYSGDVAAILRDICDTPITPELLPLGEGNKLQQETEATIGPYLLHDFFLFHVVRYGYPPRKVYFLARHAFKNTYAPDVLLRWLDLFYQRFFSQQFKRSAMPDGPKVGTVALSPRGDWRMPSDASSELWRSEVEQIRHEVDGAA